MMFCTITLEGMIMRHNDGRISDDTFEAYCALWQNMAFHVVNLYASYIF
jgi:hypothetical protein